MITVIKSNFSNQKLLVDDYEKLGTPPGLTVTLKAHLVGQASIDGITAIAASLGWYHVVGWLLLVFLGAVFARAKPDSWVTTPAALVERLAALTGEVPEEVPFALVLA